jgi:hypothetical protein
VLIGNNKMKVGETFLYQTSTKSVERLVGYVRKSSFTALDKLGFMYQYD